MNTYARYVFIIVLTALITSGLMFYWFQNAARKLSTAPADDTSPTEILNDKDWFEHRKQCSMDGQHMWESIISKVESEPGDQLHGKWYETHYSIRTGDCLLGYGYSYGGVMAKYVVDVYSNKELLNYFKNGELEDGITAEEYKKKYDNLFEL